MGSVHPVGVYPVVGVLSSWGPSIHPVGAYPVGLRPSSWGSPIQPAEQAGSSIHPVGLVHPSSWGSSIQLGSYPVGIRPSTNLEVLIQHCIEAGGRTLARFPWSSMNAKVPRATEQHERQGPSILPSWVSIRPAGACPPIQVGTPSIGLGSIQPVGAHPGPGAIRQAGAPPIEGVGIAAVQDGDMGSGAGACGRTVPSIRAIRPASIQLACDY